MQLIIRINTFGNPRLYIPNVEPNANIIINNCTNINFIIPIYFASYKSNRKISEKKIRMVGLVAPTFHYSLKSPQYDFSYSGLFVAITLLPCLQSSFLSIIVYGHFAVKNNRPCQTHCLEIIQVIYYFLVIAVT